MALAVRHGGLGNGCNDASEAVLHLLHGVGESAGLVGGANVQIGAGEIARRDCTGALCDHMLMALSDAASEKERDKTTDDCTEDGCQPESVERGAIGDCVAERARHWSAPSAIGPCRRLWRRLIFLR